MEINRASNGQEVNVRVQVALNVRANLLLVLHLKPFKTIILQFVIRLATNSGFTFVFFSLLLCLFLSFFFFQTLIVNGRGRGALLQLKLDKIKPNMHIHGVKNERDRE